MRDIQVFFYVLFMHTSSIVVVTGLSPLFIKPNARMLFANRIGDMIKAEISSAFAFHPSFNPLVIGTAGATDPEINKIDGLKSHEMKQKKIKVNSIYQNNQV